MNQQLTDKALHQFEEAYKHRQLRRGPRSLVNQGIAYLYLRKLPEAEDDASRKAAGR